MAIEGPSHKSLSGKLRKAKEALEKGDHHFADPGKAVGELHDLGIGPTEEIWPLILKLLEEINEPTEMYAGKHPPERSYEPHIQDSELIAFKWKSSLLGQLMYIKFAIKNDKYFYVSLHRNKKVKE